MFIRLFYLVTLFICLTVNLSEAQMRISKEGFEQGGDIRGTILEVYGEGMGIRLPPLQLTDTSVYNLGDDYRATYMEALGVVALHTGGGTGILSQADLLYWNGYQWHTLTPPQKDLRVNQLLSHTLTADTIQGWVEDTKIKNLVRSGDINTATANIDTLSEGMYDIIISENNFLTTRKLYCNKGALSNSYIAIGGIEIEIEYSALINKYTVSLTFNGAANFVYRRELLIAL